jgi:hypothetical protein
VLLVSFVHVISPTPRCAHQAFIHKSFMFVWGGEFSSPNQEKFMHFRSAGVLNTWVHRVAVCRVSNYCVCEVGSRDNTELPMLVDAYACPNVDGSSRQISVHVHSSIKNAWH